MKLFILRRANKPRSPNQLQRILVRARNEKQARLMVAETETNKRWNDAIFATCVDITHGNEPEILWVGHNGSIED